MITPFKNTNRLIADMRSFFKTQEKQKQVWSDTEIHSMIVGLYMSGDVITSLSEQYRKLNKTLNNKMSNADIVRTLASSKNPYVKRITNLIIKSILSTKYGKERYNKLGLLNIISIALKNWNNTLIKNVIKITEQDIDNRRSISNLRLGNMHCINIIGYNPFVIGFFIRFIIIVISVFNDDLDNAELYAKQLNRYNIDLTMAIFFALALDLALVDVQFKKYINNQNSYFKVMGNEANAFDILTLKDFNNVSINLMKLTPFSHGFFSGDLIFWYKSSKLQENKELREWIENKLIYLRMKILDQNISDEKKENIKNIIKYYENKLSKIMQTIDELYEE